MQDILDIYVRNRREVEKAVSAPFLGEIPKKEDIEGRQIVVREDGRDAVSEALDGADIIFEKFPRFKQITFDTSNDEERKMIAQAYKMRGIAGDIKESNS